MRDDFKRGYIEAIFFTESGDGDSGIPKDVKVSDFSNAALCQIEEECLSFYSDFSHFFYDDHEAGFDFWLTRNRNGAGFWDGDYPEKIGRDLTDAAHAYGSIDAYVGDDGEIYFM